MLRQLITKQRLKTTFATLEHAAATAQRCPENGTCGLNSTLVSELAHAGRITVEISGHNYRRVTILEGPQRGKSTAADPTGSKPWKTLDKKGTRVNGRLREGSSGRPQPSLSPITMREAS